MLVVSKLPPPHSLGLNMFAPYGPVPVSLLVDEGITTEDAPIMTPNKNAQHASPMYNWSHYESCPCPRCSHRPTFSRMKRENIPN